MEKVIEVIPFDTLINDFFYCIKAIVEKETLPYLMIKHSSYDVVTSSNNYEIIEKLDDILFLKKDYSTVLLYKRLNYLITLAISKKLIPNTFKDFSEGRADFTDLVLNLPEKDIYSNMLDMEYEQLVLNYDSIEVINDDNDDYQSDDNDGALGLGLSYIMYQYDPENNKNNSESTLNELTGLFNEILDRVFENGEISLSFKRNSIFRYYIHSDSDNIHIRFNVDIRTGKVTILNPITEQPMTIDIFTDWWKI